MKKQLSLLLCLLAAIFLVSGCARTDETVEYSEADVEQVTEFLIEYCNSADETTVEQWEELSEFEQEYQIAQAGLPLTPDSFLGALESWQAGVEECGAYEGHGDYSFEADKSGLTVTVPVQFEERDATLEFQFDEKLYLETMTVNAQYSLPEILEKAGLNTLLGMGTVFVVLIFISLIISLFAYIPKLQAAFARKPKQPAAQEESAPAVGHTPEAVAEASDDLELVAVIAAAVAAAEGAPADGFVVRSIRRRPANRWKA